MMGRIMVHIKNNKKGTQTLMVSHPSNLKTFNVGPIFRKWKNKYRSPSD